MCLDETLDFPCDSPNVPNGSEPAGQQQLIKE